MTKFGFINDIYLYTMKELDTKGLFDIFSQGDEQIFEEHGIHDALNDPFILFGMAFTGVDNYYTLDKIYIHKYGERYISVRDSIKMKYFNTLIKYLDKIDILPSDTVVAILNEFGVIQVKNVLQQLLHFYEEKEMYENCATIFKLFDTFFKK